MFWTLELSKEERKETISDFEKYLLIFVSNNLYFSILRRLKKKKEEIFSFNFKSRYSS